VQSRELIRQFVRETLGCTCPDEVFDEIDCVRETGGQQVLRIAVGGRLLIHIIRGAGAADLPGKVQAALEQGVAERDAGGFNRFRLVLATSRPEEVSVVAQQAFSGSSSKDEKTHLHVLDTDQLIGLYD
jgi:hypothetical protein